MILTLVTHDQRQKKEEIRLKECKTYFTYISVYFILSTKSNNVRWNRIIYLQQSTIDYNMLFCCRRMAEKDEYKNGTWWEVVFSLHIPFYFLFLFSFPFFFLLFLSSLNKDNGRAVAGWWWEVGGVPGRIGEEGIKKGWKVNACVCWGGGGGVGVGYCGWWKRAGCLGS